MENFSGIHHAANITPNCSTITTTTPFSHLEVYVSMGVLFVISVTILFGNMVVFVAFKYSKNIRTATNSYILSLSIADTFVGAFSVNLYAVYIHSHTWELGPRWCVVWLALDYWVFQASVFGVLLITVDRFLVIKFPLITRGLRTRFRVNMAIGFKWVFSFIIWVPATLLQREEIYLGVKSCRKECTLPFQNETWSILLTGLISYIIPIIIMIIIAMYTYKILARMGSITEKKVSSKKEKEIKKISIFVLLMAAAFSVTIFPYASMSIMKAIFGNVVSERMWRVGYILCYVNSFLNPICYALGNKRFNSAFKRILCGKCIPGTRKYWSTSSEIRTSGEFRFSISRKRFTRVRKESNKNLPSSSSYLLPTLPKHKITDV